MRCGRKRQKLNNRGLTLIEMVIAIAIIGIFSTVVMTFITSGANFYRKTSITTKLQSDMQTTLERIENAIMDTNKSIAYTYSNGGSAIENDINQPVTAEKEVVCTSTDLSVSAKEGDCLLTIFQWSPSEQILYYNEGFIKDGKKSVNTASRAVLTENVSGFQVDISKAKSEGIVLFRLTLKNGDKEISQLYTVTLRNKVSAEP